MASGPAGPLINPKHGSAVVHSLIYLVGLIVIVLVILSLLGLT